MPNAPAPFLHPAQQRALACRQRIRFAAATSAATLTVVLAGPLCGQVLSNVLWGPLTSGMALLGLYALTLIGAALWYDRSCNRRPAPLSGASEDETRAQR